MTEHESSVNHEPAAPSEEAGDKPARPPAWRPRSYVALPPDPAEALYYEGLAAYQHRNWQQALDRFSRLKEIQPNRPGLDALLDEVQWFLQLQAAAPLPGQTAGTGAGRTEQGVSPAARPYRPPWPGAASGDQAPGLRPSEQPAAASTPRWRAWAMLALGLIGVVALVLVLLQGQLPWRSASERRARELYNRGQARLTVGDYEGARAAFQELLAIMPDDPEALLGLSRAERQQILAQGYAAAEAAIAEGDWDAAAAELAKILALNPNYADAQAKADFVAQRQRLAELYADGSRLYDLGQWEEAIRQFEKIRELDSSYRTEPVAEFLFVAYLNAGQALMDGAEGQVDPIQKAVEYFSRSLAIHPRNRLAADARRLGGLYLDAVRAIANNNLTEAQARLQVLVAEAPSYANGQAALQLYNLLLQRAQAAVQAGDTANAVRLYREAQAVPVMDRSAAVEGEAYARTITPTPAPAPTELPGPTAAAVTPTPFARVRAESLNLRAGPGTAYPVVGQARVGDLLTIIGRNADGSWLQVCAGPLTADKGCTIPGSEGGWILASLAEINGPTGLVAVITPRPPPPPTATPPPPTPAGQLVCVRGQVRDVSGAAPLAGWTVTLRAADGSQQTQRTAADGSYAFNNLKPGTYTVQEVLAAEWRNVSPASSTVVLAPATACLIVDFWNERAAPVTKPPR